jgi:TPR repeat protein
MSWTWSILAVTALFACGHRAPKAANDPAPEVRAPVHLPAQTGPAESPAARNASTDSWTRELIDPSVHPSFVRAETDGGQLAVLVAGNGSGLGVLSFAQGALSARAIEVPGPVFTAAWQSRELPWVVYENNNGELAARSGFSGPGELLGVKNGLVLATDINIAPSGKLGACLVFTKQGSSEGPLVFVTRAGQGNPSWRSEELPVVASQCAIVATADSVYILSSGPGGVVLSSKRENAAWRHEQWSADGGAVAATRGLTGTIAVGYATASKVELKKYKHETWQPVSAPSSAGWHESLALALSSRDEVHAAFDTRVDADTRIEYWKEGDAAVSTVAQGKTHSLAVALDASGEPHLLYASDAGYQLIHAHRSAPSGTPVTGIQIDPELVLQACAMVATWELGESPPSTFARGWAERWCRHAVRQLPGISALRDRCEAGNANACVVGGLIATSAKSLTTSEVTPCLRGNCRTTFQVTALALNHAEHGSDETLASKLLARGCDLGEKVACVQLAQLGRQQGRSPVELLSKACNADLPIACATLVATDASKLSPDLFKQARARLTRMCDKSDRPESCNALAFLEERGLGGNKQLRQAEDHHRRACELGSGLSCARLLVGPFARRPPPPKLGAEQLEEVLTARCETRDEAACLALTTAFEIGWGVKRDRAQARKVLEDACDDSVEAACRRIGRKAPKTGL